MRIMTKRLRIAVLTLTAAAMFLPSRSYTGQANEDVAEEVAVVTGYPETLAITDYDIALRTDLDNDRIVLQATCTLRNKGLELAEQADFDLMAMEQFYGVRVEILEIVRLINGKRVPVEFTHGALTKPEDSSQEGSMKFPKIVRVKLSPSLRKGEECRLKFDYSITHVDPKRTDLNYRIVALLPDGSKEVCFLSDFSWIPRVLRDYEKWLEFLDRNFFSKGTKPTWRITLVHPSSYESLVVDGRLGKAERAEKETVSRYVSAVGGCPQLLIGNSERVEVKDKGVSVIFLLPKGKYERDVVEVIGKFLVRANRFYSDLYGPLEAKDIHVAVSSAGMGGHGAYLGMFLNAGTFQKKRNPDELAPSKFFDHTGAHELAHSWWGHSVDSYGRGTKFLHESLAEFSTGHFQRERYGQEPFATATWIASLLRGQPEGSLFSPTGDSAGLAYTKGARILDILRKEMGSETFFQTLRAFAARFKDSHASFADFVTVCNEVSHRDWLPFFNHWCYGTGCPVYRLASLASNEGKDGWETTVAIRNDGKGIIRCPLELRMGKETRREVFVVPEGEERTFTYRTTAKVDEAIIDPELSAYQADVTDVQGLLRIAAATKESPWEWLKYWLGVAFGKQQRYEEAIEYLSLAVATHEEAVGKGNANPAFYFSRGIAHLRQGEKQKANDDIRLFLKQVLNWGANEDLRKVIGTLAYAGLVSPNLEDGSKQLQRILELLTGKDISADPNLREWNKWWKAHEESFELSPNASGLTPGGLPKSK